MHNVVCYFRSQTEVCFHLVAKYKFHSRYIEEPWIEDEDDRKSWLEKPLPEAEKLFRASIVAEQVRFSLFPSFSA